MKNKKFWMTISIFLVLIGIFHFNTEVILNNNVLEDNKRQHSEEFTETLPLKTSNSYIDFKWNYNYDYGNGEFDLGRSIVFDSESNIYIGGNAAWPVGRKLFKFDQNGTLIWNYTLSTISLYDIVLNEDDNICITGNTGFRMFLEEINCTNGQSIWYKEWPVISSYGTSIQVDSNGDIYVGGYTRISGEDDVLFVKYNSSGDQIFNFTWGEIGRDEKIDGIAIDSEDNIYLAGYVGESPTTDILLIKLNQTGDLQWNLTWNGINYDVCYDIKIDSDNNIFLAGRTNSIGAGGYDMILLKYNSTGDLQFNKTWGLGGNQFCNALDIDKYNNLFLAGNYLVKLNNEGNEIWNRSYSGTAMIESFDVELDVNGNIFLTGYSGSWESFRWNTCVVKFALIPQININSPTNYQLFGNSTFNFNVSNGDEYLNTTWYSINFGTNYTYLGNTGTVDQALWDTIGNGTATLRFFANNSASEINYKDVFIRKDISPPQINIITPKSFNIYGNASFNYNLSILEGNLDSIWYSFNEGENYSAPSNVGTIDQSAWDACGNGLTNLTFYVNDTLGNIEFSKITIQKDESIPEIVIHSPISNELFGLDTIDYNITLNKRYLNTTWYSLTGGQNYTFTGNEGKIDQTAWDTCGNGTVSIRFYANDSLGDISYEDVIVRKDTHTPNITINEPLPSQVFSATSPNFNVSFQDPTLNVSWYVLNESVDKYFFTGDSGQINQTAWNIFGSGVINITFYANNSLGNINSKSVLVEKDVSAPVIFINSPNPLELFSFDAPSFDLTIVEPRLNSTWYTLDGTSGKFNFSGTSGTIDQSSWDAYGNGTVIIRFYANDTFGYEGSQPITVRKDIIKPDITINSPESNGLFGPTSPTFDITISESNLDKTWYSLNSGANISFSGLTGSISQTEWDLCGNGTVIITFYANDSQNNIGSKSVAVRKDLVYIPTNWVPAILIDDTNPSFNWAKTVNDYSWCSGSGTWSDPYTIENLVMRWVSGTSCITIQNSNVYFKIKYTTLTDGGGGSTTGGIKLINASNGLIIWNDCSDNVNGIVLESNSNNNTIIGNVLENNFWMGIFIQQNCDDNKIIGNIARYSNNGIFIRTYCNRTKVISNIISNIPYWFTPLYPTGYGIYIQEYSDNPIVENNHVYDNERYGIQIGDRCLNPEVSYNTLINNSWGLWIGGWSHYAIVRYNNVSLNVGGGIQLTETDYGEVYDNLIIQNNGNGLKIYSDSNYCTIKNNLIMDNNGYGLNLGESVACDYNTIYNNTFIGNNQNALEFTWGTNNNYYSGTLGNFWDDYTGVDSDEDGIGDTSYDIPEIPAGNVRWDPYPIYKLVDITLIIPIADQVHGLEAPTFIVSIDGLLYIDTSWYQIIGGSKNFTFTGTSARINQTLWDEFGNGSIILRVFINDTLGNLDFDEVNLWKDTILPEINIISPLSNDFFGKNPPQFTVFINDTNLDTRWYSLDGGLINITFIMNETFDAIEWDKLLNGTHTIIFYVNDTAGNINSDFIEIYLDIIAPQIIINTPENYSVYQSPPSYNIEIYEYNNHSLWYTLNLNATLHFFYENGTLDLLAWNSLSDGYITIRFYANDTVGNLNSSEVIIVKDTLMPLINIITPTSGDYYNNNTPQYNIEIFDLTLNTRWYSLNGGINHTFSLNSTFDTNDWISQPNGTIIITFYANDTLGREASQTIIIFKDIVIPEINIISPTSNQNIGSNAPSFTIKVNETNLDKMWYKLNNGLTNYTFTTNATINHQAWSTLWNSLSDGDSITIRFYAEDKAGNIDSNYIIVIVDKPYIPPEGDNFIIIIIISTVSIAGVASIGGLLYFQKIKGKGLFKPKQISAIKSDKVGKAKLLKLLKQVEKPVKEIAEPSKIIDQPGDILSINQPKINDWFNMGTEFAVVGEFEKAIQCYDTVLKTNPQDYEAWYNKGAAFQCLGNYEEAIKSFDNALKINPEFVEAIKSKEEVQNLIEKSEEYNETTGDSAKLNQDKEVFKDEPIVISIEDDIKEKVNELFKIGIKLGLNENYMKAIETFDKILELEPKSYGAWYNKGLMFENIERYNEAINSYDKAIAIKPNFTNAIKSKNSLLNKLK
jgi:parallel beta-helix repeat protein